MIGITDNSKHELYFDLKRKLNEHLKGNNKNKALDHTSETDIQSSSGGNKLKIALHLDPFTFNDRTVTLRSLTNPSVAVRFNEINTPKNFQSPLDDIFFKALDFILKLVPQDFNSIATHSKPQEGDTIYFLKDNSELDKAFIYVRRGAVLENRRLHTSL